MTILKWSDDYLTGIPMIDSDHRTLFDLVNLMDDEFSGPPPRDTAAMANVFQALVDYVEYHFQREEQMLSEAGYGGLDGHQAAHRKLAGRVLRFKETFEQDQKGFDAGPALGFLSDWLSSHILETDMNYVAHVKTESGPGTD